MNESNQINGVAGLKKYKMKTSTIVFMIYSLCAAGAFGIENMIPMSGPGLTIAMLLVIPIIWGFPISFMVAELGAVLPAEGGVYVWVKEALGEFWGFLVGWWSTISIYIINALYVVLIVGYMSKFIEMNEVQAYALKVAIILIFTIVNLMGIQEVGKVSTVLSILVLIAFAVVAVVGFMHWNYNPMAPFMPEGTTIIDNLGGSIAIALWMYCGFECLSTMAGEIENPQVIPKGLLIAMPLIVLSYVLPTIAGLASVGNWESWATEGEGAVGYVDVLLQYVGPIGGVIFLVVAVLSQASMFNAYIASGSRGFFVLADDNLCPKFLVKVSKKRGVPYISILLLTAVTFIMVNFDFTALLLFTGPLALLVYIMMGIAVRIIRKKYPISERKGLFVIPGGKIGFNLVCTSPVIIGVIALLVNGLEYFLLGFVSLFSGIIAYLLFKWIYGGLNKVNPEDYPINPKTRLALGDTTRIALYFIISGLFSILGSFAIAWYEGEWGPYYYLDTYGSGLASNFDLMLTVARYTGAAALLLGIIIFAVSKKIEKVPSSSNSTAE